MTGSNQGGGEKGPLPTEEDRLIGPVDSTTSAGKQTGEWAEGKRKDEEQLIESSHVTGLGRPQNQRYQIAQN